METILIIIILLLVGGGVYAAIALKKKEKKREAQEKQRELERQAELERQRRQAEQDAINNDPCRDMRDGSNFSAYMTPQECNKHGYFWCPIAKRCMPSSVNVNDCGKPARLM